jgi:hypothetical protein
MGNPIKYSTSVTSGSYQKGNNAIGVNPISYGPTSTTGWYNSPTPTGGNFIITEVVDGNTPPRFYAPTTDNEWLRLARQEGATGANTGSTASIKSWFASQANYVVTNIDFPSTLPSIVGNGQVTYLDSEFTTSYPGSGTTWSDISGLGNNTSLTNGPTFNSGGKYIQFDGIDDYTSIPNPGDTGSIQFTYYWPGSNQSFIAGNLNGYAMLYNGGSGTVIHWYPASGTYEFAGDLPNRAGWYNITVTWGGTNDNKLYMNGALVMSSTAYSIAKPPIWYFAGGSYNAQAIRLQTIQAYNKILTQAEVLQNHHKGNIVTDGLVLSVDAGNIVSYESGSTTTYNLSGSSSSTTQGILTVNMSGSLINGTGYDSGNGGSWVFDGVDDYISVPDNAVLNFTGSVNLTSEVWIKFNQYKDISFVNAKGDGGGGANNYNYFFIGTNTSFYFRFSDGTTTQNSPFITQTNLPTGFWGHVVGVLDTTAIRLYLNGVEIGTATTRTINPKANNSSFLISSPSYALNGSVATSRIYNRALTAAEIQQNFNAQRSRFGI